MVSPRRPFVVILAGLSFFCAAGSRVLAGEEQEDGAGCASVARKVAPLVAQLQSKRNLVDELYQKVADLWAEQGKVDHEQIISDRTLARDALRKAWSDLDAGTQTAVLQGLKKHFETESPRLRAAARRVEEVATEATRRGAEVCATVKLAAAAQGEERRRLEGQAGEQLRGLEKDRDDFVKAVGELRRLLRSGDGALAAVAEVQAGVNAVNQGAEDLEKKSAKIEAEAGHVTQRRVDADAFVESLLKEADLGLQHRGLIATVARGCESDDQVRRLLQQAAAHYPILESRGTSATEQLRWFERVEKVLGDAASAPAEPLPDGLGPLEELLHEVAEAATRFQADARTEAETAETFAGRVQAAVDAAGECVKSLGGGGGGGGGGTALGLDGFQIYRQPSAPGWLLNPVGHGALIDTKARYDNYTWTLPKTLPGTLRMTISASAPRDTGVAHATHLQIRGNIEMLPANPELIVSTADERGSRDIQLQAPADTTQRYELVVTIDKEEGGVIRYFYAPGGGSKLRLEEEEPEADPEAAEEMDEMAGEPPEDAEASAEVEAEPPPQ